MTAPSRSSAPAPPAGAASRSQPYRRGWLRRPFARLGAAWDRALAEADELEATQW